jgi:hypothetical protein
MGRYKSTDSLSMETLREILATFIFTIGIYFVFVIFAGFQWINLIGCIICFIAAYYIWPSKTRGHRVQDNAFLDILEFIIELPVDFFLWIIRFFGHFFSKKDGGFDLDIDL